MTDPKKPTQPVTATVEPGAEASFDEAMRETLNEDAPVFKRLADYDADLGE